LLVLEGVEPPKREHLDLKCTICGYRWAEPCKDAKP
jgi:hypothetical protein